ncbi:TonB family protein [Rheinheimera maricola]|uniref:Protein TonB n=1 Tax=Rheinheimera maricola TaxID=2793282 RepID=A0ABS7XDY7_9GAMM|nr:TonB family protein [Rheinheimera maricola]MBZ9613789.1 TonB family protein [Rheinheimera maricola]
MRWLLALILLWPALATADWLAAMQAYEKADYATARAGFEKLLPLGNAQAAFNLAAMAYQGQGQSADNVSAVAYFAYAGYLGHVEADSLRQKISKTLSAEQLHQAEQLSMRLQQSLKIPPLTACNKQADESLVAECGMTAETSPAAAISTVIPKYPSGAARYGITGYVRMRFLLDAYGKVQVVDFLDSFPRKVFDREAKRALLKFEYAPVGTAGIRTIQFDFTLDSGGGITPQLLLAQLEKHNLWVYAIAGSQQHQEALGTFLSLLKKYSPNKLAVDPAAVLDPANPDWSVFSTPASVNDNQQFVAIPEMFSEIFWWRQAAKNGDYEAQRILSSFDQRWRDYLIEQEDAEVMAWYGADLVINGDIERGVALLDKAIAAGYGNGKDLKSALLGKK